MRLASVYFCAGDLGSGETRAVEDEFGAPHRHEFSAFHYHLGPYAPRGFQADEAHVHSCFTDGCSRVLIGRGRECDGKPESHTRYTLTEAGPVRRLPPKRKENR